MTSNCPVSPTTDTSARNTSPVNNSTTEPLLANNQICNLSVSAVSTSLSQSTMLLIIRCRLVESTQGNFRKSRISAMGQGREAGKTGRSMLAAGATVKPVDLAFSTILMAIPMKVTFAQTKPTGQVLSNTRRRAEDMKASGWTTCSMELGKSTRRMDPFTMDSFTRAQSTALELTSALTEQSTRASTQTTL